jgi:hypothetical protein
MSSRPKAPDRSSSGGRPAARKLKRAQIMLAADAGASDEEIAVERQRNATGARVKWMFTTERARAKLARAYPDPAKESQSLCRL